jgi:hypothetical protein
MLGEITAAVLGGKIRTHVVHSYAHWYIIRSLLLVLKVQPSLLAYKPQAEKKCIRSTPQTTEYIRTLSNI